MNAQRLGVFALMVVISSSVVAARESRGWIGLGYRYQQEGAEPARLVVRSVAPHGPAFRAGLRVGDVITAIDGRPVADQDDVLAKFVRMDATHRFRFVFLRENRARVVELRAVPLPPEGVRNWETRAKMLERGTKQ